MKRLILLAAAIAILAYPITLRAEPFAMPNLPDHEVKESKVYYQGKPMDFKTASTTMRLQYLEAPKYLTAELKFVGQGSARKPEFVMSENLNNGNKAVNTFTMKPGNILQLDSYEKIITTPSGKRIRREFFSLSHPSLGYPNDLMHPYALELAFRGMKLDAPGTVHKFNLWLPPTVLIPMEARVMGIETVSVESGARKCYRVDMYPGISSFLGPFMARLLKPLVPAYVLWFDVNGTHPIVRYKGPLGKVNLAGVPDEVYDLVKVDPDPSRK